MYLFGNVVVFLLNPFVSRWHYCTQSPAPIHVVRARDADMSVAQIVRTLEDIDLAYGARRPTCGDQVRSVVMFGVANLFFPATLALNVKAFVGYIGPANQRQQAFTLSVKRRYNHLAELAIIKGYQGRISLFQLEPSLSKRHVAPSAELRSSATEPVGQGREATEQEVGSSGP